MSKQASRRWIGVWLAVLAAFLFGERALAHHSAAGVDQTTTITVKGTLKDFDLSAPHALLVMMADQESGEPVELKVSTIAPVALIRQGFKPKDFASGIRIEMSYHPNRFTPGGVMMKMTLPDGRVVNGGVY
jgi:hypothetical protein